MNNKFGFTMTELIIALVIVGILSLIAIPSYRGYVRRSVATEGKAVLGELDAAEQIYYSRNGKFHAGTDGQQASAALGVDFKNNKYFTSWYPVNGGTNDTAGTYTFRTNTYKGKAMTIRGSLTAKPEIIDNFTSDTSI